MIISEKKEKVLLYSAYDMEVYGKEAIYRWTYDGSGREETCYTFISIKKEEKEIYSRVLGNNVIFKETLNRNIDNLLWHILRDTPDNWTIDDIIQKALIENFSLFSYRIEQRKQKEKIEKEQKKQISEREAVEKKKRKRILSYCKNKNLYCRFAFGNLYVFRINKDTEKMIDMLNKATEKQMSYIIEYMNKYPDRELTSIYIGSEYKGLDTLYYNLKEVA